MRISLRLPVLALVLLAPSIDAKVWKVDAHGYPTILWEIQYAIDMASAGDTILVESGLYLPIAIDKNLNILAQPGSSVRVQGLSSATQVTRLRLAGLQFQALNLTGIDGTAVLESCSFGEGTWSSGPSLQIQGALHVVECADLLLTRSSAFGQTGCCGDSPWPEGQAYGAGSAGARFENSNAVLVDCRLRGGQGESGCYYNSGGSGLELRGGQVVVVGSDLEGGPGGMYICLTWGPEDPGGDAAWVPEGTLILRGAGLYEPGADRSSGGQGSKDGYGVRVEGTGRVFASGTEVLGTLAPPGGYTALAIPEPFLEVRGEVVGGKTLRFDFRAPLGEPLVMFSSLQLSTMPLAGWEGTLWISPFRIQGASIVVGAGQGTPVFKTLVLPPNISSFVGAEVGFQILAPYVPGTVDPMWSLIGNPVSVLLR